MCIKELVKLVYNMRKSIDVGDHTSTTSVRFIIYKDIL